VDQYDEVLKIINGEGNTDKFRKEAGEAHQQKGQLYFINKQYERRGGFVQEIADSGKRERQPAPDVGRSAAAVARSAGK